MCLIDAPIDKGEEFAESDTKDRGTEAFGIVLLRSIVTVDPSFLDSFVKTLDTDTLNAIAPQFLEASLNTACNSTGALGEGVLNPQQLLGLLKDEPATLVAVFVELFFPDTSLIAENSNSQHTFHMSSGHQEQKSDVRNSKTIKIGS